MPIIDNRDELKIAIQSMHRCGVVYAVKELRSEATRYCYTYSKDDKLITRETKQGINVIKRLK